MWWAVAAEVAISVAAAGSVIGMIVRTPNRVTWAWGAAAFLHMIVVWAFVLWNRAGTWKPLGETTTAFLAVMEARERGKLRAARFMVALLGIELVLLGMLEIARWRRTSTWLGESHPLMASLIGGMFSGMILMALWLRRRAEKRLVELVLLRQSFAGEPDPAPDPAGPVVG
jgi:hypothetical protein